MKTIALSMIFSLAVIVCEQQTLFAPHFISFDFQAPNSSNSLIPIAGVNRSVPLAGSGNGVISAATEFVKNDVWVLDTGAGLTGNGTSGPDRSMATNYGDTVIDGNAERFAGWAKDEDHKGYWHRGYFGLSGTAGPGGSSF